MTNPESNPAEQRIRAGGAVHDPAAAPGVQVLTPREVPLGGQRAMTVRRTLPRRDRSLIGAWCFADHYGPDDVTRTGGMDVAPHPHTGLQTVSWLFAGEVEHRDSLGTRAIVRPGELNLMTSGHGVCHSETSMPGTSVLHGVQLWVALPDRDRRAPRAFAHHVPEPIELDGGVLRVFLGSLGGATSPVATFTPLLGAELVLDRGASVTLPVDRGFEHGVLVDTGDVTVDGCAVQAGELGYVPSGAGQLTVANTGAEGARMVLLGGEPFEEEIVMWWNFVGRSHEEIVAFREAWQAGSEQFGEVVGYAGPVQRLPAPVLPSARMRPRGNP